MPKLRSEDRLAPRVQVLSPTGEYVFSAHREQAERLVREGSAVPSGPGRRVRAIALTESLADHQKRAVHQPTPWDYAGQRYTFREGNDHQFKGIDSRDELLFRMAVIDCLSAGPRINTES